MADKIRTFIAISLPDHVLHGIGNVQASLKKSGFNIRWVRKEGIHLTLRFLGDVPKVRVEQISSAISAAVMGFSPFTLKGHGVGVFRISRRSDFSRRGSALHGNAFSDATRFAPQWFGHSGLIDDHCHLCLEYRY